MHPNIWKHAASETRESDVLGPVLLVPGVERERDGDYLDSESKSPHEATDGFATDTAKLAGMEYTHPRT